MEAYDPNYDPDPDEDDLEYYDDWSDWPDDDDYFDPAEYEQRQYPPVTAAQQLAARLRLWASRLLHKIRYIGRHDPYDDIPF